MSSLNDDLVRGIVQRIVDTAQPEKVILFGSQARGDARVNSDFDVLAIKHSDEPRYRRSVPLYVALADLPVEVEVMVYTPEEVEEWSEVPQAFVTTALREGTTIYERAADLEKQVCATPPARISP
jgi:predicted nucleotidyltransferase